MDEISEVRAGLARPGWFWFQFSLIASNLLIYLVDCLFVIYPLPIRHYNSTILVLHYACNSIIYALNAAGCS